MAKLMGKWLQGGSSHRLAQGTEPYGRTPGVSSGMPRARHIK